MTSPPTEPEPIAAALARCARETAGLQLLLLFGSRARGDVHAGSDWDLGYLVDPAARETFDPDGLLLRLVLLLGTEQVDLVDLSRAGGLLRFRAAGEGRVLYEAAPGVFDRFWFEAVSYWCDMQPILERGYQDLLDRLPARP